MKNEERKYLALDEKIDVLVERIIQGGMEDFDMSIPEEDLEEMLENETYCDKFYAQKLGANTYHNKHFREAAEARGLHVERSEKYGWSHTEPTEELLDFVINNQLTDILINRNEANFYGGVFGGKGSDGSEGTQIPKKTSSSRKYICPCCGLSVRATKIVRIKCIECDEEMIEC